MSPAFEGEYSLISQVEVKGDEAFALRAPRLWNKLSEEIRRVLNCIYMHYTPIYILLHYTCFGLCLVNDFVFCLCKEIRKV